MAEHHGAPRQAGFVLVFVAMLLTTAVMRGTLGQVGPITPALQEALSLGGGAVGMLTTLPLLVFAASSFFMAPVAARVGIVRVFMFGTACIAVGCAVRALGSVSALYAGTICMGLGISCANVLMPAYVKERFPNHIAAATGLYATSMTTFAGISAGLALPMAGAGFGWQGVLAFWAPFAAVGALVWFLVGRTPGDSDTPRTQTHTGGEFALLVRSPIAWFVTGLTGLQSLIYYSCSAWLPSMLAAAGLGEAGVSIATAAFTLLGIPCSLVAPLLCGRMKRQRALGLICGAFALVGAALLAIGGSVGVAVLSVFFLGLGVGALFPMAMTFVNLRTTTVAQASALSGMAQGVGYLIAATGPAFLGVLADATGTWHWPAVVVCLIAAALSVFGWLAGAGTIKATQA